MSVAGKLLAMAAAMVLGGCGGGPTPAADAGEGRGRLRASEAEPDATGWLGSDPDAAREAGAEDFVMIRVGAGVSGDRLGGTLEIPPRACSLVMARGTESIDDVDVFAYADDGTVLGADESTDQKATILVCPPHPSRVYVVARIASGHGLVALGAQRVDADEAEEVGRAVGARGRPGEATGRIDDWPGLTERIAAHRRRIGSTWQDVRKVAVPLDPHTTARVSALVAETRCLDVLVVPSDEVAHLDVSVVDVTGRILGRGAAVGRDRTLVVCSPTRSAVTLQIRPHAGRGLAAVVLSRSVEGARAEIESEVVAFETAPLGDLDDTRRKHRARLQRAGYGRAKTSVEGAAEVGRRTTVPVKLVAGCSRIDVLAGTPLRGVEAWLWNERGELVANGRGGASATLFACGAAGPGRLDVEPTDGAGRFAVELRAETGTTDVLATRPLAAGRLLSRMFDRGLVRRAHDLGPVEPVDLSPTRLHVQRIDVPVGRCADATVALDGDGFGAELRLIDAGTLEELRLVRGTHTASGRVCALDTGRSLAVRAELRAAGSPGPGLFAVRMLSPRR